MKRFLLVLFVLTLGLAARPAHALLGGFEQADGYVFAYTGYYNPPTFDNWVDVTMYNAGQWGANAGGGPLPVEIPLNSGLWSLTSAAGAFYPNPTLRNTYLGSGPPYPATTPSTLPQIVATTATYAIGNHFGGRLGTTALALRNADSYGPITYDYKMDTYDFGGNVPALITSGTITQGFYFQPNPSDSLVDPSGTPLDKFIMSFTDSTGSIGFQWGYLHDNSIVWRAGNSGTWNTTGLFGDTGDFDGVTATIDLTAQTFGISYYDISTTLTTTLAPAGTPMGNSMGDFTHLGWYLDQNLTSGVGGKNFFDDFSFATPTVVAPEPASLLLLLAGGSLVFRRRR